MTNIFPSDIFYTQFSHLYSEYAFDKKLYISAVNNFIKNETPKVETMIDIGAGDGKRGKYIAELLKIKSLTLLDNSNGMIALSKNIPNIKFEKLDISNSDFSLDKKYDVAICLWNVLGHISYGKMGVALKNIASVVNKNGIIFIDVNNRYNIAYYGLKSVIINLCKDIFLPRKNNGDFIFEINTGVKNISTIVHIFNPNEIENVIKSSGLAILKRQIIDYETGKIKKNLFGGQIVYKLSKI